MLPEALTGLHAAAGILAALNGGEGGRIELGARVGINHGVEVTAADPDQAALLAEIGRLEPQPALPRPRLSRQGPKRSSQPLSPISRSIRRSRFSSRPR